MLNRKTLAWSFYDVAASTYVFVPVILFPIYFRSVVAPGSDGDLYLGLTVASALIVAAFSGPLLGILADRKGIRWRLLATVSIICCCAIASLAFLSPASIFLIAVTFAVGHTCYLLAMSLYDSYLPSIAGPLESGRVSGFGWAFGYFGGIMAIIFVLPWTGDGTGAEYLRSYLLGFIIIAAMYSLLAVVALVGLLQVIDTSLSDRQSPAGAGIWNALRIWHGHREIAKFLLASFLINDGMVTVSVFAANYFRTQFGTSVRQLLFLLLAYHLIAIPATLAFGYIFDRWDPRKAIGVSLSVWVGVLLLMSFGTGPWVPTASVLLLGCVYGSTLAMLRGMLSRMVPVDRAAEFFGFNMFAGRLSAALGPLLFGLISAVTGSQRMSILSILAFIIGGAAILTTVKLPRL